MITRHHLWRFYKRRRDLVVASIAPTLFYDRERAELTRQRDELPEYDAMLKAYGDVFKSVPRTRVMDVGCGTGRYFQLFPDAELVVGVDPSAHMLELAQRAHRIESLRRPPLLVLGDVGNIPMMPNSFDLVFSIGVFGQVAKLTPKAVRYLLGFCNDGGTLVLSVLARKPQRHIWPVFNPSTDAQVALAIGGLNATTQKVSFTLPSMGLDETFHIIRALPQSRS